MRERLGPIIAVLLDENTSSGGNKYEADKRYFRALQLAGGCPIGLPYTSEAIELSRRMCAGLMLTGGRYAYPPSWYIDDEPPEAPHSERLDIELEAIKVFLDEDRPVLGICAGMQSLAGLNGCRMTTDLQRFHGTKSHNGELVSHRISIRPDSKLHAIIREAEILVNSFHIEAITKLASNVEAGAFAEDGVIEAIELRDRRFAIGVQWHAERHIGANHPSDRLFTAFVHECQG